MSREQPLKYWDSIRLGRRSYLLWGSALLCLKMMSDSFISWVVFDQYWTPAYYLVSEQVRILMSGLYLESAYYYTMLLASLPFIIVGVVLSLLRLRAAALPLWLSFLFFLPTINLLFFAVLCVVPNVPEDTLRANTDTNIRTNPIETQATRNTSFVLAVMFGSLLGLGLTAVNIYGFRVYGAGLFVGSPFCIGMITPLLVRRGRALTFAQSLGAAVLAVSLTATGMVLVAMEGLICIVMALPLWLVCSLLGGVVGYLVQSRVPHQRWSAVVVVVLMLSLPILMGAEAKYEPQAPLYKAHTDVYVRAPIDRVWANVVSFPDLGTPDNWLFQLGVAYPVGASIDGHGVGAIRRCTFSTGDFVEPITVWDEPFHLAFDVTENPPPMREWSPYENVHPPHLDGYFISRKGEFRLTPISDELTRLEGTTWYQQQMWPAEYWRFWSNMMIRTIHYSVLDHVRTLSEVESQTEVTPHGGMRGPGA